MPFARCDRCETIKPATNAYRLSFDVEISYMMLCPGCCKCYSSHIQEHPLPLPILQDRAEYQLLEKEKIPYVELIRAIHWVYDHEGLITNEEEEEVAILYFKKSFPDIKNYRKVVRLSLSLVQKVKVFMDV